MERGRGYRTAQPVWLGGDMRFEGRPPVYILMSNNGFFIYEGFLLPFGNDKLDHVDLINNGKVFQWSAAIKVGGHDFGIKVRQRPLYFSPDNNFEVLMVDNFGNAGRWNYAIRQEDQAWGLGGFDLFNPNQVEVSPGFAFRARFALRVVGYHDEP